MRILLIEDDRAVGASLCGTLHDFTYAVDWVRNGTDALNAINSEEYGLILLDLGLPGQDGFTLLDRIRSLGSDVPVIVVTAHDEPKERVQGLDLGADDYIVKPFNMDELMARIRAVTRRGAGHAQPLLTNGIITLNPVTREAAINNMHHTLSAREFALVHALMLRPGAILSRKQLEDEIYGWNEEIESNAVEFLIHSVRKKLGTEAIRNVRGLGWMVAKAD